MSVSKKVLRRMKKVMGVIGASASLIPMSSQVSCTAKTWCDGDVQYIFEGEQLSINGEGMITRRSVEAHLTRSERNEILNVYIGQGITKIGVNAFCSFKKVMKVYAPFVKSVSENAFFKCDNLTEVDIYDAEEIGKKAFYGCCDLEKCIMNSAQKFDESAFEGCSLYYNTLILHNAEVIGKSAFKDCCFKNVNLPKVKCIGDKAFYECMNLKNVSISGSINEIGDSAFNLCEKLESIVFDNCGRGKDIVALNAFNVCSRKLRGRKKLGKDFYGNLKSNDSGTLSSLLKKFLYKRKEVAIGENAFGNCKMLGLIDTDGMVLNCHKDAFCGTPVFRNLGGKVICGKYHFPYHQDMVAKALLLDSINDRFNKNGEEKNPVDCPLRYPPFSHSCC